MTNWPNGTLYLGVTGDIARRAWEHREGVAESFSKRYGLTRLVYAERHDDIAAAIRRERTMKHWPRAWNGRGCPEQSRSEPPIIPITHCYYLRKNHSSESAKAETRDQ